MTAGVRVGGFPTVGIYNRENTERPESIRLAVDRTAAVNGDYLQIYARFSLKSRRIGTSTRARKARIMDFSVTAECKHRRVPTVLFYK